MQIKILLVEDQKLMRIGIKSLFCDYPELEIIGEAINGKEAVEKARLIKPDIVLMDIGLPDISGIEATKQIIEKANKRAVYFNNIIKEKFLPLENVGEVRHIGLVNAIELVKNRDTKEPLDYTKRTGYQIYKKALEKGVLLRPLGDVIYFNPPLIIEESDMDFVTDIALECTKEILSNYLGQ